jgi:hypothetical protein
MKLATTFHLAFTIAGTLRQIENLACRVEMGAMVCSSKQLSVGRPQAPYESLGDIRND